MFQFYHRFFFHPKLFAEHFSLFMPIFADLLHTNAYHILCWIYILTNCYKLNQTKFIFFLQIFSSRSLFDFLSLYWNFTDLRLNFIEILLLYLGYLAIVDNHCMHAVIRLLALFNWTSFFEFISIYYNVPKFISVMCFVSKRLYISRVSMERFSTLILDFVHIFLHLIPFRKSNCQIYDKNR